MRGSDERERAGFFVYPGVPALLRAAHSFLGEPAGFVCGYFYFALKLLLLLAHGCCEVFREKEALWTSGTVIKFWQCTEKSLEEYFCDRGLK